MGPVRWLAEKDLRRFAADKNGAAMTLVVPVVLAALLGSIFGPREKAAELSLLVVDLDETPNSAQFVKAIDDDPSLSIEQTTEADARSRLETGDAAVAVVLPKGTGAALTPAAMFGGDPVPVQVLHDPSRKTEADLCVGMITKITMQEVGRRFSDRAAMRSMFEGLKESMAAASKELSLEERAWLALFDQAIALADGELAKDDGQDDLGGGGLEPPLKLEKASVTAAGPASGYNSYSHNFSGMLCMFLLFWALDAGKELIVERESGALTRIRLSPVTSAQILTGRAVSTWIIAMVMSACVYVFGMLVFGVQILGSVPGFLLVIVCQGAFIAGFAVLLAGVGRTERQIANVATFAILIMSFLGGVWMPSFILPTWVQSVSQVLPTYWATEGLAAMTWRALPLSAAFLPCGVLAGMGLACGVIGWRTARWD